MGNFDFTAINPILFVLLIIILVAAFILLVILLTLYILILSKSFSKAKRKADCIIVPGAKINGRSLELRIKKAYMLYSTNMSNKIIVTGSTDKEDATISEAEFMADALIELGVLEKDIILEEKAFTTLENFIYSKLIMDKMGFKSAIIATNTYHAFRCASIAKKNGLDFQVQISPKENGFFFKPLIREVLVAFRYYILRMK